MSSSFSELLHETCLAVSEMDFGHDVGLPVGSAVVERLEHGYLLNLETNAKV